MLNPKRFYALIQLWLKTYASQTSCFPCLCQKSANQAAHIKINQNLGKPMMATNFIIHEWKIAQRSLIARSKTR